MLRNADVVKHGSATGLSKAGHFGARLTHFLTKVNHRRRSSARGRNHHCRQCLPRVASKLWTCNPLLVVVFEEMQHIVLDIRQALQDWYQIVRGAMALHDVLQRVVELYLVV